MQNHREELDVVLTKALAVGVRFGLPGELARREQDIRASLGRWSPEVMVYGYYNSGKSTLLNALVSERGEEMAATSDAPCTDSVTAYRFGDWTLWDTPGIDAPIEHERVARDQLARCDLVLFVVSTGGQYDEQVVQEEWARVLASGRRLIVVLNDKGGAGARSPQVALQLQAIRAGLRRVTGNAASAEAVDVVLVNARRAVEARQAGSAGRYEQSGARALEELLMRRLVETKAAALLEAPVQLLNDGLIELRTTLETGGRGTEAEFVQELVSKVESVKKRALLDSERDLIRLRPDALRGLKQGLDGAGSPEALQTVALKALEAYRWRFAEALERRLASAAAEVEHDFARSADAFAARWPSGELRVDVPTEVKSPGGQTIGGIDPKHFASFMKSPAGKAAVHEGLRALQAAGVAGLEQYSEKALANLAKRVAAGLGVFLEGAVFAWQIYQAHQEQRAAEEAKTGRAKSIDATAVELIGAAEETLRADLPKILSDAFGGLEAALRAQLKALGREAADRQQAVDELRGLEARVTALRSSWRLDEGLTTAA